MKMWQHICVVYVSIFFWSCAFSNECITPLGETSKCISIYACPDLRAAFKETNLPEHMMSFLKKSHCGFAGKVPVVCCGPLPKSPLGRLLLPATTEVPRAKGYFPEDSLPAPNDKCGFDRSGDRIYGGEYTKLEEFPWVALMMYRTGDGSLKHHCGGSLINNRYALTAAHCILGEIHRKFGSIEFVRLGEYDIRSEVDCPYGICADRVQEIPVASTYPHPEFDATSSTRKHDIGIVRLAERAVYTYYVQPICLASSLERLSVGDIMVFSGWGKTLDGPPSPVKQKIKLPLYDKEKCIRKFGKKARLGEKQFCAGGVFKKDTCDGDSGGPLMKKRPEGSWMVVGVNSFGRGCGLDGWPAVYTSVPGYVDWIKLILQSSNQPEQYV